MKTLYIIVKGRPWFYPALKLLFPAIGPRTIVTFGKRIYIPGEVHELGPGVLEHEIQHVKQQKGSSLYAVYFLIRYTFSREFRYRSELEAYMVQWQYIRRIGRWHHAEREILEHLARDLSGPIYGNLGTLAVARELIEGRGPFRTKA